MEKVNTSIKLKKRRYLSEIVFLRSIACLCIAVVHSLGIAHNKASFTNSISNTLVDSIYVLFTFGTPTFIFISMLLISYSYPNGLPRDFLLRRFTLIMLPFIFMAIFYGADMNIFNQLIVGNITEVFSTSTLSNISSNVLENLIGGYHGYFILIIFQFYILTYLFHKFFFKSNPVIVISLSLFLNLAYLSIFNFTESPTDSTLMLRFWKSGHWIPFVGWIFYFSLAFYCGLYYHKFIKIIKKYKNTIVIITVASGLLTVLLTALAVIPLSSKTVTMLFFTTGMIGVIYLYAIKKERVPRILLIINSYSFSIYLLNTFYINITYSILLYLKVDFGIFNVFLFFIMSTTASIWTAYLLNKFAFGKYLVGRVNVSKTVDKPLTVESR